MSSAAQIQKVNILNYYWQVPPCPSMYSLQLRKDSSGWPDLSKPADMEGACTREECCPQVLGLSVSCQAHRNCGTYLLVLAERHKCRHLQDAAVIST